MVRSQTRGGLPLQRGRTGAMAGPASWIYQTLQTQELASGA
jgi:hypothetical protein